MKDKDTNTKYFNALFDIANGAQLGAKRLATIAEEALEGAYEPGEKKPKPKPTLLQGGRRGAEEHEPLDPEEESYRQLVKPGVVLYGYCGGLFGRDSYGDKIVRCVTHNDVCVQDLESGHLYASRGIDGDVYTWKGLVEDSNEAKRGEWGDE